MNRLGALFFALLALFAAAGASAQNRMSVSLVAEHQRVAQGSTVTVAFVMRPAPGWHGYWRNPGDAGAEPRVQWRLPEGWTATPLQYPAPDRLLVMGLMNYVYERDYALLATLNIPADAEPGVRVPVDARLDYLVCTNELCVPETANVTIELDTGAPDAANPAFAGFRQSLPRALAQEGRFETSGGRMRIAIPLPAGAALNEPYLFPVTSDALRHSEAQTISRAGDMLIVETAAGARAAALPAIEGVLELSPQVALSLTLRPGAVPAGGAPIASVGGGAASPNGPRPPGSASSAGAPTADPGGVGPSILLALLGALVGGLLLNIMPCVFPILSLKALSLARAGETEGAARREALAYAAGVVLVCLALGGLLLALRAGGSAAGWAFQLQDPRVIGVLLLLVAGIAFNLAGLFELPTPAFAGRSGAMGSFATGALAAFVATPCSGPFMAGALGAALVLPAAAALAVFAGLGIGIALPFLAIGFIPALRRRLPKPGMWMVRLRHILSVPMFLTALALAWILGQEAGVAGMTLGLAATLLASLGFWWTGLRQHGGKARAFWPALVMLLLAVAIVVTVKPAAAVAKSAADTAFTEARLDSLRKEGRPVFAYFTADWCLSCKVNEAAAIERSSVREAFARNKVAVLVGDWTDGDPVLGRFIERHNRAGVPLYLYYAPGAKEPQVLPQVLTPSILEKLGA